MQLKNTKLIKLLITLDNEEVRNFDKYIHGLYAGHSIPLGLFRYLKQFHPHYESEDIQVTYIMDQVLKLPEAPKKRLSNEFHKIFEWLMDFLFLQKLRTDPLRRDQFALDIFRERRQHRLFFQKAQKVRKAMITSRPNIWKYFELMKLACSRYYYAPTQKLADIQRLLVEAVRSLQVFYHISMIKLDCEIQSRSRIMQNENTDLMSEFSSFAFEHLLPVEDAVFLKLYQAIRKITSNPSDDLYRTTREIFFRNHQKIHVEDNLIFLNVLTNYAIGRIKHGKSTYIEEVFELYRFGDTHSLLLQNGYISTDKFRNIILTACVLKELDWAEKFLTSYLKNITEQHQNEIEAISRAQICFAREQFEVALSYLHEIPKFKDYGYSLQAKLLQLKCYFELRDHYELVLRSFINAFDNSLLRNKSLHQDTIQSFRNLIRIVRLLIRSKNLKNREEILKELESLNLIAAKPWLLEKTRNY